MSNDHQSRPYWIHALTPLHVGSGRGIGFIDLPIAREAVTNYPYVPGSAIKGVLADHHGISDKRTSDLQRKAFGKADQDGETANSGSLVFTDAHLICLPVRSIYGTFAWTTCPAILSRLKRDFLHSNNTLVPPGVPEVDDVSKISLPPNPASVLKSAENVYFEDLDFGWQPDPLADEWSQVIGAAVFENEEWRKLFQERFAVVHNDVFTFLCEHATQVDARVRIDSDTKTVKNGQLWYEESLPSETILAGIAWCGPVFSKGKRGGSDERKEIVDTYCSGIRRLQIGGKATIGRGQATLSFQNKLGKK